ncbi:hypothetical protein D0T84_07645 [Dysgonomonas sp. 521]|uniref:tetratricopeptide repeat protein n=1 Tax=Dysgonomonas sp. 521 TaxID=2302932 RepID=UPI0013D273A4|nr:LuxR C-terminal-related transcriptional regulator [Dysgonomonas sp. 521]NDV94792.1 hypothetical protein [Dysgonomonas sp. 521]
MRQLKLYIILIIPIFYFSCSSESKNAREHINIAESLIESKPDSALALLDSVLYPENLSNQNMNRYYLLWVQARDRSHKDISKDTIIFKVKNYYKRKDNAEKAALACFYSGKVLRAQKNNKDAMTAYMEAETYADQTQENYNVKGLIQSHIGYLYYNELLQDEALTRFKKAVNYFEKAKNFKNEAYTLRDIGNSFLLKKESDSAFYYYQKGLDIADISKDSVCQSSIRMNIGAIFKKQEDYVKSKEYLNDAIIYASNPLTKAKIYSTLAQVLNSENKNDSAIYYFEKSLDLLKGDNDPFISFKIYKSLSEIEEAKNNYTKALEYNKDCITNLYNIYEKNENQSILEIQKKYDFELIKNTNNRLLIQRQFLIIVMLGLGLIILVIFFYFYYKNQKKGRALLEAEQKIIQLSQMAKSYNKKEDSFRNKLLHHFDILKKSALLEGFLREDEKKYGEKLLKKFNEIVYNQATLDWNILYQTMNELHDGFFDSLRETFPQLDESEFRICCLIYSDFTNSEISIIMGQSINTVTSKRSTIRKKIGVKDYGNIVDYLNSSVKKK